jgi:hypothetical protein
MSEPRPCPICDDPLKGHAELSVDGGPTTFVADCPTCGRYALGPDVIGLASTMSKGDRFNLMARLEMRSIPAGPDGTVILEPGHFKK